MKNRIKLWLIKFIAGADIVLIGAIIGKDGCALTIPPDKGCFVDNTYIYNYPTAMRIGDAARQGDQNG